MPAGYNNSFSTPRRSDRHREQHHHHHNTTARKPITTTTTPQRHQNPRRSSPPPARAPPPPPTHRVTKPKSRPDNNSKRDVARVAEPYSYGSSYKDTRGRYGRPSRLSSATTTATTPAETGYKTKSSGSGSGSGSGLDASYRRGTKRHSSPYRFTTSGESHRREHATDHPQTSSISDDVEKDEGYSHNRHSHNHGHKSRSPNNAVQPMSDDDQRQILDSDEEDQNNNDMAHDKNKDLLKKRKRSRALKAALTAGAVEAFRQRKRPGEWVGQKGVRVATAALSAGLIDIGLESRQQAAMENDNNENGGDEDDDQKEQGTADGGSKSDVLGASSRLVSSALGGILIDKVANGGFG